MTDSEIQLFFPTDEEIGCLGAKTLDKALFNPKFAYTIDGGPLGEINYETFNAASATITIKGVNIHPGLSKNKMRNAILIAKEFMCMLPAAETPEHTENYEGYYHIFELSGTVEEARMRIYIRDHDRSIFEKRKNRVYNIANYFNELFDNNNIIQVDLTDTYSNIKEKLDGHFEIVEAIINAMKIEGIVPFYRPMRGGTDGTILSSSGIPCPNICAGGHNYHSCYEYISVQSMEKISAVLINIVRGFTA